MKEIGHVGKLLSMRRQRRTTYRKITNLNNYYRFTIRTAKRFKSTKESDKPSLVIIQTIKTFYRIDRIKAGYYEKE